jgi:protein-tyrosine phosphatase
MLRPDEIRDMEHKGEIMSYNRIEDFLYAGNNMCCQTHFDKELLSQGISADISLEAERLDNPKGVNFFFWFPWQEDTAPTTELINLALATLDSLRRHKIKAYVHCKNGHGRTTTLLASYFIRKNGMTTDEALKLVKEKRPSMHLNEEQKAFLKKFEKSIK